MLSIFLGAKSFINNEDVKSAVVSGAQWDYLMSFLNGKKDAMGEIFNVRTGNVARHLGRRQNSGINEHDKVFNIYDMEGNVLEMTAEICTYGSNLMIVTRGGHYSGAHATSVRSTCQNYGDSIVGYRMVLYVM